MFRGSTPIPELIQELCAMATCARNLVGFRREVLVRLQQELGFDAALAHEFSPRVPLSRAAVLGLSLDVLAQNSVGWDETAVRLQPLLDTALTQGGAATDREAFPLGSKIRRQWETRIAKPLGIRSLLIGHLIVNGRVISALLLLRNRGAFTRAERQWLTLLLPCVTLGDTYWQNQEQQRFTGLLARPVCRDQRLTARQRQIVERVALGHTNRQIAEALDISANTVRNTLVDVCERLGAGNRADVVRLAVLS